tara:strand:- start:1116 stop:1571 length:456 start_codon:yes stop_codon:yes gene_type:complete
MIIKSLDHLSKVTRQIGEKIDTSDCIFLYGEIGTGKTTFTRLLINFLQKYNKMKTTEVLSPTFNLLYEYDLRGKKIKHYDLYRLKTKYDVDQLGIFADHEECIKVIEWPEHLDEKIVNKISIFFNHTDFKNERKIEFSGQGKWKNFKLYDL